VVLEKDGKISLTVCVSNEAVLHRVKQERNMIHTVTRREANWIGHILRRKCILKHIIKGKIEEGIYVTGRQGRSRMQLPLPYGNERILEI
jgi:hypothetical protein